MVSRINSEEKYILAIWDFSKDPFTVSDFFVKLDNLDQTSKVSIFLQLNNSLRQFLRCREVDCAVCFNSKQNYNKG